MEVIKTRLSKQGGFPVNEELAGLVPMATDVEQAVLTADIGKNEQQDPIVLWRGEVVDGRCRQKALTTLGKHIMYRELDSNLTKEEVQIFVKSVNTRRNLTVTQKIMSACRESLKEGSPSIVQVAKSWGIGDKTLKNARYIARTRPEFVQPLFDGSTVTIVDRNGLEIQTNKVTAIYAYLKRIEETVAEDTEYAWTEDSYIQTHTGKEWYYRQLSGEVHPVSIAMKMHLAELANYKFRKENEEV